MKTAEFLKILEQDVLTAAPLLLGAKLVHEDLQARIVEVEAYRTPDDPACHAHRGNTPRCARMFDQAGLAYVYFTYGNHWMLNMVGHERDNAAAILIRAALPLTGIDIMTRRRFATQKDQSPQNLLSGPGKICKALGIDRRHDGVNLLDPTSSLRVELSEPVTHFTCTGRIGLNVGAGDEFQWRFCDTHNRQWVSNPKPTDQY